MRGSSWCACTKTVSASVTVNEKLSVSVLSSKAAGSRPRADSVTKPTCTVSYTCTKRIPSLNAINGMLPADSKYKPKRV